MCWVISTRAGVAVQDHVVQADGKVVLPSPIQCHRSDLRVEVDTRTQRQWLASTTLNTNTALYRCQLRHDA